MNKKYNIEDKHEIASIINRCLSDGYCDASMLARRIAQAWYGNNNRVRNEFAEKLKNVIHKRDYVQGYAEIGLIEEIDELLKEYENDFSKY